MTQQDTDRAAAIAEMNAEEVAIRAHPVAVSGTISNIYNVKTVYRASGDGVTDDHTAINNAIIAANAAGGGVVYLPPGTYRVSAFVSLLSKVSLQGAGRDVTIIKAMTGCTSGVVVGTSGNAASDLTVSDLTVDGDYTSSAIALNGIQGTNCSRVIIERVRVTNVGQIGILLQTSGTANVVFRCKIDNNGLTGVAANGHGIKLSAVQNCKVNHNWILGTPGMGIATSGACTSTEVDGNYIDKQSTASFEAIGIATGADECVVRGNWCLNTGDNGISYTPAKGTIVGNIIDTVKNHGIALTGNDTVVTGNYIRNPNGSSSTFAGISTSASSGCVIGLNRILDDRGGSALMAYGIKEITSGGNSYSNNTITGAVTSSYLLVGSTSKVHDSGFLALTYGVAVATDAANATTFKLTVTDGVALAISAPTNPSQGRVIRYDILNSSGGAMGVITWNAVFKLAGSFTNPASTKRRTISFYFDGTSWVEQARAAADI